jgi:hypothetical protein
MEAERFKALLDELDGNSLQTLKEKNARYSQNGDCLHNFRSGAEIVGGTPAQACWGYLTKHLVALRDMVNKDDFSNREDFLEKCQDTINYIRFLWCIGNDKKEPAYMEIVKDINELCDSTSTGVFHLEEVLFPTYKMAVDVLENMIDVVKTYGNITVAHYYHLCDLPRFDANVTYGWTSLNDVKVRNVGSIGEGYVIDLPEPRKL